MARWAWTISDRNGAGEQELTVARARNLKFALEGPATASFDIDGRHELAAAIDELATDVHAYRNGTKLYRGRVGPTDDSIDEAHHTTKVPTADYRAVLARRLWLGDPVAYSVTDQAQVAWDLIAHTQGQAGGDLGITRGAGQVTGVNAERTIEPGMYIGDELQALAKAGTADGATPGFDWRIGPELTFDVYYPRLGRYRPGVVLEYGGLIRSLDRKLDPSQFANAIRHSGDGSVAPVIREASDLATRPEGRWDRQLGDTSIGTFGELVARTEAELEEAQEIRPSWSATFRRDGWEGPGHVWLGDTVTFVVRSGRIDHVSEIRVEGLTVDVDDDGEETVAVQFGPPMPDLRRRVNAQDRRLGTLERT